MKSFIVITLIILICDCCFAQIQKGTPVVSMNLGLGVISPENEPVIILSDLFVKCGYVIAKNLLIGLEGHVGTNFNDPGAAYIRLGIGSYARYYFNISTKSKLFLSGNLGYDLATVSQNTYSSFGAGAGFGYTYILGNKWGLEAEYRYHHSFSKEITPLYNGGFQIGVSYYFNR